MIRLLAVAAAAALEGMHDNLGVDVVGNVRDYANGDALDEIRVELWEGSEYLVGTTVLSAHEWLLAKVVRHGNCKGLTWETAGSGPA